MLPELIILHYESWMKIEQRSFKTYIHTVAIPRAVV
jgi:hypothetical protein